MSYTNSTTHYGLPLPTGSDKSLFTDTNQAFQDIDAAIYDATTLVGQAGTDIGALQGRMTTAEGNISDNADDIAALKGRMTAVEGVSSQNTTDIADVRADAEDMITAHNEATATSTSHYDIGDEFIYNDVLYLATAEINIGDTIVPNTNCEATNVMTEVAEVKSALADKADTSALNALSSVVAEKATSERWSITASTSSGAVLLTDANGNRLRYGTHPNIAVATELDNYCIQTYLTLSDGILYWNGYVHAFNNYSDTPADGLRTFYIESVV